MKTSFENSSTVERKWHVVDATGQPLGRLASQVAAILRGKHKTSYTPHVDTGDYVIVINSDKVVLTGNKAEQKMYRTHSGYIGNLKETKYKILLEKRSDFVVTKAIKGMMPKNSLGRKMVKKLHVYKGETHKHEAQKPQELVLKGVR